MPSTSAISWSVAPRSASRRQSSASSGRYRVGAPLRMPSATCSAAMRPRALVESSSIRAAMSSRVLSLCPCPRALCGAHWYPAARYAADALFPLASAFAKSSWRAFGRTGIVETQHVVQLALPYHNIGDPEIPQRPIARFDFLGSRARMRRRGGRRAWGLRGFGDASVHRWRRADAQRTLLPNRLEDYVSEENPVRVIEVFIDELDLAALGFSGMTPAATGRLAYHPSTLLKIYLYGYLNRVQSSRRLERERITAW